MSAKRHLAKSAGGRGKAASVRPSFLGFALVSGCMTMTRPTLALVAAPVLNLHMFKGLLRRRPVFAYLEEMSCQRLADLTGCQ